MKSIALSALAAVLIGCASHDSNLKRISGPSIELPERLVFSAISAPQAGPKYFHALKPGHYKASMEDLGGTYYAGDGALLVLGGQVNGDGSVEEPMANGGFWLAKSKSASPSMRLFYMPGFGVQQANVDSAVTNTITQHGPRATMAQGAIGSVIGGLVIGAIVSSGAVGYGPKNGEPSFVPRMNVEEEDRRFESALQHAAVGGKAAP